MSTRRGLTAEQRIRLVKRQRTSPTAMGCTPESFFRRAVKGTLASQGDSHECAFPESSKLIKTVKACKQSCAAGAESPQIAQEGVVLRDRNHQD